MSKAKHYYTSTLLWVITLFILFTGCFILFQNKREKSHQIELLHTRLQDFNYDVYAFLDILDTDSDSTLANHFPSLLALAEQQNRQGLRLTLIDTLGYVIYDTSIQGDSMGDSSFNSYAEIVNHFDRSEVREAFKKGEGIDIIRHSATTGKDYFYTASYLKEKSFIVRSAMPYNAEMRDDLTPDSHYLWIAGIITLLLLFIFWHITRKMGSSIDEKENLLAHLRISNEGLGVFSPSHRLILANNLFNQYANLISDRYLSKTEQLLDIKEFTPMREFLKQPYSRKENTGEPCLSFMVDKGGRSYSVKGVKFSDGGFEISINDVTEIETQSRLKRQLTQNIAHELKTPVSSISGYIETIIEAEKNGTLSAEKRLHFLSRCYSQSERLHHLVQDIAALDRMNNASYGIRKESVDISSLVNDMLQEEHLKLEQQQMSVQNLLPSPLIIKGDASMLYSIFRNLLDNAISYAGTGASITLQLIRSEKETYYFSFSDNGCGIEEEHLPRIFERFYRIDKGRSRKLGGTGLGLAIVKNAVILHGGNITARQRPGGGLEFLFTLST